MTHTGNKYPAIKLAYDVIVKNSNNNKLIQNSEKLSYLIQNQVKVCIHNSLLQWKEWEIKLIQLCEETIRSKRLEIFEENNEVEKALFEEKVERRKLLNQEKKKLLQEKKQELLNKKEQIQKQKFELLEKKKQLLELKEKKKNYMIEMIEKFDSNNYNNNSNNKSFSDITIKDNENKVVTDLNQSTFNLETKNSNNSNNNSIVVVPEVKQVIKNEIELKHEELQRKVDEKNGIMNILNSLQYFTVKCYQSNLIIIQLNIFKDLKIQLKFELKVHKNNSNVRKSNFQFLLNKKSHNLQKVNNNKKENESKILIENITYEMFEYNSFVEEEIFCFQYCKEYLFNNQRNGPLSNQYLSNVTEPIQIPQLLHTVSFILFHFILF